jgi:hypothetical protein
MAFPPAFTSAWDNTFPPDTQLANLLGADLRLLRVDTQQRFALQAGTFANRPSNMDATFGGVNFGILYWAIDTGQIFQWSGAAWVEITQSFLPPGGTSILDSQGNLAPIVGTGAEQTIFTKFIPANTIQAGKGIRITLAVLRNAGLNNATFKLKTAATAIETITAYAPAQNVVPDQQIWDFMNDVGSQNTQTWVRRGFQNMSVSPNFSVPASSKGVSTVDWSVNQTLSATCTLPATDQFTPIFWLVENIH